MPEDPFRPSEYTAALLRQLQLRGPCKGRVLEMGTGSGVVLAALAAHAREVVGVDVEPEAVDRTRALLKSQGVTRASVRCGSLWEPLDGERFDLVAFNPPQFPVHDELAGGHRLRSWSHGGADGRQVLDGFLRGLAQHLMPGGAALITHSSFIGLERTAQLLRPFGLRAEVAQTLSAPVPAYKLRALPAAWLDRHLGRGLHGVGPYVFADFHVLEIRHGGPASAA